MLQNLAWTGHLLHHSTADGTVVDADPTLEELMTHVAPDELPPRPAARPDALPAVPVIRDWYEREPGRTWMQQSIARSQQEARWTWCTLERASGGRALARGQHRRVQAGARSERSERSERQA
jgi:hypothetical protein